MYEGLLDELSLLMGIVPEYYDIWGVLHKASPPTKKAVLSAMGVETGSEDALMREIQRLKTPKFAEPAKVTGEAEGPAVFILNVPCLEGGEERIKVVWRVEDEYGGLEEHSGDFLPERFDYGGRVYGRLKITDVRERPAGYYEAYFSSCGNKGKTRLIVTPEKCFSPAAGKRLWGITVNLYSVRSGKNWGIGDFGDLRLLLKWTKELGGDFVGVNPLHAIPNSVPFGISPYFPISRLYGNFIYIDMDEIEGFDKGRFRKKASALRRKKFVDYEAVASLKRAALRESFGSFNRDEKSAEFRRFMAYAAKEGGHLRDFATFMALTEAFGPDKRLWPEEYAEAEGPALAAFRIEKEGEVLFHCYLQWIMEEQIEGIKEEARLMEMEVGLYNDLAVGSSGGGSDAWSNPAVFASGADMGAPPDDFSLKGQKWGFPPLIPERLKETGYEIFIKTIRKNMERGGLLRIDHALGLFRAFWVPEGMEPKDGAYVAYSSGDMMGIVALESKRSGSAVVAEDLGTVGPEVREALRRAGMLSYRLFYFERRYPKPSLLNPEEYPREAFAAVTTHDLPTLAGYWAGRDIELRKALSFYPEEGAYLKDVEDRLRDKGAMLSALKENGLLPEGVSTNPDESPEMTAGLSEAVYAYLARTPTMLIGIGLDDMLGELEQANMPGTIDEHPNWKRKCRMKLSRLMMMENGMALAMKKEGRGHIKT